MLPIVPRSGFSTLMPFAISFCKKARHPHAAVRHRRRLQWGRARQYREWGRVVVVVGGGGRGSAAPQSLTLSNTLITNVPGGRVGHMRGERGGAGACEAAHEPHREVLEWAQRTGWKPNLTHLGPRAAQLAPLDNPPRGTPSPVALFECTARSVRGSSQRAAVTTVQPRGYPRPHRAPWGKGENMQPAGERAAGVAARHPTYDTQAAQVAIAGEGGSGKGRHAWVST
jgi:hypothetical protein